MVDISCSLTVLGRSNWFNAATLISVHFPNWLRIMNNNNNNSNNDDDDGDNSININNNIIKNRNKKDDSGVNCTSVYIKTNLNQQKYM